MRNATTSAGKILVAGFVDGTSTVIEVDPRTGAQRPVATNAYWLTPTRDRTKVLFSYPGIQSYDSATGLVTQMNPDFRLTLPGALSADGSHWWIYRERSVEEFDLDLNWVRGSEVSGNGIIPLDQPDRLLGDGNVIYQGPDAVADQTGFDGRPSVAQHRLLLGDGHTLVLTRPNLFIIDVAKIVPFRDRFPA